MSSEIAFGLTDDDYELAIATAVKAADFGAVEALLASYAVRNPARAALVIDVMRLAVRLR